MASCPNKPFENAARLVEIKGPERTSSRSCGVSRNPKNPSLTQRISSSAYVEPLPGLASNRMDLAGYLKSQGVWHRFLQKPETVHTADASAATGIDLARITKNLVCTTSDDHYALLIVPGNRRVNLKRAAQALNTPNVQLLAFSEAESISGYPPGATPSVHHKTKMNVIVDVELLSYETIFCGGGSRDKLLELKIEDVVRLDQAAIADISEK